jgi:Mn-dependent DtxR family transcriptional regulator
MAKISLNRYQRARAMIELNGGPIKIEDLKAHMKKVGSGKVSKVVKVLSKAGVVKVSEDGKWLQPA